MTEHGRTPLSLDALLAEARRISGIDRLDEDAVEPLTALCRSYGRDSQFHAAGVRAMQAYLVRVLSNRLRMQRDFARYPEISAQQVAPPLFLWGMPRTGTTKLQKLLAASGDFNWLSFWKSHNPSLITGVRGESPEQRIAEAAEFAAWFASASPDTGLTHPLATHEPEEESFLLMQSLRTPCFMAFADVTGYLQWLATQDASAQFRYLRDTLKYLQWQGLGRENGTWVLKSPLSYGMEASVLAVFPGARLVMTHRHPEATIASFCSTIQSYYHPFSDAPINHASKVDQLVRALDQHLEYRTKSAAAALLDVNFADLVSDSEAVTQRTYAFCEMKRSEAALAAMRNYEANHQRDQKGVHRYSLQDFGLTKEGIAAAFGAYRQFLDNWADSPRAAET